MTTTPLWKSIAQTLQSEIATGHYVPGDKLPTEADLSRRFSVNRHTVRRALADLNEKDLVHSRRGSGVFVAAVPTDYPIGRRVRFHQNLEAAGQIPEKAILRLETRNADTREIEALKLSNGAKVHVYEGISLANGLPVAFFCSIFPAQGFPNLLSGLEQTRSVTKALAREGVLDYTRALTRLTAELATAPLAVQLKIAEGAPVLRSVGVNIDKNNQPVEYGRTWFSGDRISLVVTPE